MKTKFKLCAKGIEFLQIFVYNTYICVFSREGGLRQSDEKENATSL